MGIAMEGVSIVARTSVVTFRDRTFSVRIDEFYE